mmetsp:Transcript_4307/g.6379  ORF Transcript_4307/g.6379 Transcript_4307/m.6379 type:complete len:127 (+) Transcript_4307:160-540(+)
MDAVTDKYNKLQEAIEAIGSKIHGIISQNEEDFLAAYKLHVTEVQSELRTLKLTVDEKDAALSSNERVKNLELERDWYKTEALRLDAQLVQERKTAKEAKERLEEMKFNHDCLSKELQQIKRESKA